MLKYRVYTDKGYVEYSNLQMAIENNGGTFDGMMLPRHKIYKK